MHGVPFRSAHAIAGRLLQAQRERPDAPLGATLARISGDLLGVPIEYSDAQIAEILSPRHFVEVRATLGGPAPAETARALDDSRERLDADRSWRQAARGRIDAAEATLRERCTAL
jgi:argininosuccinate lyase